ncbi:MAG: hypothetical protein AAGF81_23040 [Pseudomonadota bacterium]
MASAVLMGGVSGFIAFALADFFALSQTLVMTLSGVAGLLGAAFGWRFWYKIIDGALAGI